MTLRYKHMEFNWGVKVAPKYTYVHLHAVHSLRWSVTELEDLLSLHIALA